MNHPSDFCAGHPDSPTLADVIVSIQLLGRGSKPFVYALCIECAEAHTDLVERWEDKDLGRVRGFTWAKHPNCFRS